MPTAVEMKWLGNTTGFSVDNAYGVGAAIRNARIPLHSVSAVLIKWGGQPSGHTDSWEGTTAVSQQRKSPGSAPVGLSPFESSQLSEILASLKTYMGINGRISVSGLSVKPSEAMHFSSIAGVPVTFMGTTYKDNWPGTGGTVQDNWPGIGSSTPPDDWMP